MSPQESGIDPGTIDRCNPGLNRFSVFAFMWAFQVLEEKSDLFNAHDWSDYPVVFSALTVLFLPNSATVFLLLCSFQLINCYVELPFVMNHIVAISLINAGFLVTFLIEMLKSTNSKRPDPVQVFDKFAAAIRWMVILLYFIAAFHKLNWGYFDTAVSCFRTLYLSFQDILYILPPLTEWTTRLGIYLSVIIEVIIPAFLLFRRTRLAGILIGIGFHLFLGLGYSSFSVFIYSLYFLFLPADFVESVKQRFVTSKILKLEQKRIAFVACVLAGGLWFPWHLIVAFERIKTVNSLYWFFLFVVLSVLFVILLSKLHWKFLSGTVSWRISPGHGILLLLLTINGISPYLGLKTATAFSMYSNLRTEKVSNHMLLPKGIIQIVDYQDDLVKIVESNYPPFDSVASTGGEVPFKLLQQWVFYAKESGKQDVEVTFLHNDRLVVVKNAEQDPVLSRKPSWFFRKFAIFRLVPPEGKNPCQW